MRTRSAVVALTIAMAIVVCLTTLVERSRAATIRSLERAGLTNVYLVQRPAREGRQETAGRLTVADVERARTLLPVRSAVAIRVQRKTVEADGKALSAAVYAFSGPLAETFGARCRAGRFLGDLDVERKLPYCLVGRDVKAVAGWTGTVGRILTIGGRDGRSFEVVGELAESEGESASVGDIPAIEWNRSILVPLGAEPEAAREADARYPIDVAVLRLPTIAEAGAAAELLGRSLEGRRDEASREEAIRIASPIQTLRQYKQTRRTFDRLIWLVCLLTAASAVFGISNQLSASVIARTKEIGVRRAVGARSIDIVLQFQAEGLLLGIAGGGAGLLVGWLVSLVGMDRAGGWSLSLVSFSTLALGCVVAGILTGIRPSIRASRIDPAAALREG